MIGKIVALTLCMVTTLLASESEAIEVAERISDKEVVERLTRLEEGQNALNNRFDDLNSSMNQRFNEVIRRFEYVNNRFEDVNNRLEDVNNRFDDVNNRFNDMNRRLDDIMTLLQIVITALLVVGGGLLGWMIIIWRKLVKVEERQSRFETQDDEIKFLKEAYNKLNDMVVKLMGVLIPEGEQSQRVKSP